MPLFLVACVLAGLGGVLGSVLGRVGGSQGLVVGGIIGGLLGACAGAVVARSRNWITARQVRTTALGACAGFIAAALIATHTLSSPVGPILSTSLVGIGAHLGASMRRDQDT